MAVKPKNRDSARDQAELPGVERPKKIKAVENAFIAWNEAKAEFIDATKQMTNMRVKLHEAMKAADVKAYRYKKVTAHRREGDETLEFVKHEKEKEEKKPSAK